jgi:hypothetical protein
MSMAVVPASVIRAINATEIRSMENSPKISPANFLARVGSQRPCAVPSTRLSGQYRPARRAQITRCGKKQKALETKALETKALETKSVGLRAPSKPLMTVK